MSFSIPKVPKDRKLEQVKRAERTPLRKSLSNSFVAEELNQNDEEERNKRRSMAYMQKRMSTSVTLPTSNEYLPIAEHEMKDHIDICLKMFMENKITAKNAWGIKIIDYMRTFLQSDRVNKDSLQVGSTSLDVGAKVYSIRVDDVHSIGLKLASNMSKMAQKQQSNESAEDADNSEKPDEATKPTKKKRKFTSSGVKHTIAKDVNLLLGNPHILDSAFFQTKSNAELSTLDNFLTNRISMDKSGCMFTLMNEQTMWTSTDHSLVEKLAHLKSPHANKINICPDFCNFEVDVWDPDNDNLEQYTNNTFNTELVFDDEGIPMAELDGSIHKIFNESDPAGYGSSEEEQEPEQIAILDVTNIRDLRPTNALESSEYAYQSIIQNNKCITNIWAGPSHWKFKHLQRAASKYSGVQIEKKVSQKKRTTKDKNVVINFMEEEELTNENDHVVKKKTIVKPWPQLNNFCTKINHSKLVKILQSVLLKPAMTAYIPKYSDNNHNHNDSYEVSPYNYQNPNDSFYCPQNMDDDDDHHDDSIVDDEEIAVAGQNEGYVGDNIIDLPDMVHTSFISYATRAKKMDMKKLKASVWKILVDDTGSDNVTEDTFKKQMKMPMMFSDIYNILPTILNKSMREELSSPLAFMAILHLANEQNLELIGQADLANFSIRAGVFTEKLP